MPKKWDEVASSPAYQALQPFERQQAQEQYFNEVVAPQIKDDKQLNAARDQFMSYAKGPEGADDTAGMGPLGRGIATAIKTALPVDAIREMSGQMAGTRSKDLGSMLGSAAQLGLAAPMMATGPLGAGARAAAGAAGLTAGGLEAADVKNPFARAGLPFLAGLAAGHYSNPQTALKAVPKGDEANAVARLAQGMGIDVAEAPRNKGILGFGGKSPAPQDISANWKDAVNKLGQRVGETKGPALETAASTRQILNRMSQVPSSLEAPGVMNLDGRVVPELSNNPAALKLVQERLAQAMEAAKTNRVSPSQAMEGFNNALEGLKKTVAESGKYGESMAGQAANAGTSGWQAALDSLAKNPEALAEHNAANLNFRKGLQLKGLVESSIGGKAGPEPGFNPRTFGFGAATAGVKPGSADLSALSPEEMAQVRQLVEANPNLFQKVVGAITGLQKDLGREPLHFHPSTRFYEQQGVGMLDPRSRNALVPTGAAYRSATYDPTQDDQVQGLADKAKRLSRMTR